MTPSYRKWTVRGYMRPVIEWDPDGVPFPAGHHEPVVVVFDPRGWEWHVTTEDGRLTSLVIRGEDVDQKALRTVPVSYLREIAETYRGHVEQSIRDGMPLGDALADAEADPGQTRRKGDPPSVEEFAASWHETPATQTRPGGRTTRRQALATRYHVSPERVDQWTRAARDTGLIPPAKTGRPRQTDAPSGPTARTNKEKKK